MLWLLFAAFTTIQRCFVPLQALHTGKVLTPFISNQIFTPIENIKQIVHFHNVHNTLTKILTLQQCNNAKEWKINGLEDNCLYLAEEKKSKYAFNFL